MPELLLLTIDSLRFDHFNSEMFSECWNTFDSDFVRFDGALANGVATPLSFPSILTGCPVTGDGTLAPERPTVAELYDGYAWAASNNPHLRPGRNYDRGFDFFVDDLEPLYDGNHTEPDAFPGTLECPHGASERTTTDDSQPDLTPPPSSAEHVLAALREGMDGQNGFFWAHFIDPHYQFKPQKVLDREVPTDHTNAEILEMNERYVDGDPESDDVEFLRRMYEELIAYLDRHLADLFEHLKAEGRWEETAIVLAVDHGEAFGEQGVYNHQWDADPINPLVRVPLLVKLPGAKRGGETYDHLVQNADILPTLAEIFDWDVERPPRTRPLTDPGPRTVVSKSTAAVQVTTDDGTAVRRRDGSVDVDGAVTDDAMAVLESTPIPAVEKLSGNVPGLSDEERQSVEQRLEALGYR